MRAPFKNAHFLYHNIWTIKNSKQHRTRFITSHKYHSHKNIQARTTSITIFPHILQNYHIINSISTRLHTLNYHFDRTTLKRNQVYNQRKQKHQIVDTFRCHWGYEQHTWTNSPQESQQLNIMDYSQNVQLNSFRKWYCSCCVSIAVCGAQTTTNERATGWCVMDGDGTDMWSGVTATYIRHDHEVSEVWSRTNVLVGESEQDRDRMMSYVRNETSMKLRLLYWNPEPCPIDVEAEHALADVILRLHR